MAKEQIKKPKSNKLKTLTVVASALAATTAVFVGLFAWKAVTNKPSGYVKVSFDTGISHFSDGNNLKTIYVENGTKLKDIKIEWPVFDLNETFAPTSTTKQFEDRQIEYWTNKVNGEMVQQDEPFTKDVELVANYYSLSQLKDLCLGISLDNLVRAIGQRPTDEELVNYYKDYEKDISLYENESEIVARTMLVNYAISQWILRPADIKDCTSGAINNINICKDQRAQSIASLYINCWTTMLTGDKDKMISALNNLYPNIIGTSVRYTHWCTQVCNDSFLAIYNAANDEIKSEFISETRYFTSAIDRCYKYDTVYKVSEIASLFFDETSDYTDIDEIKKAFYGYDDDGHVDGAKDYVERLISWEEKYE